MSALDVLLLRHSYDDHSYIDGLNDTSLTPEGVEIAKEASFRYARELGRSGMTGLSLRVSSKKRAVETADIFSSELSRYDVDHDVVIDSDLRELYQGEMVGIADKTHEERVRMLELGWEIFERERIASNDDYKYGTPDRRSSRYDIFNDFIAPPYGESQNELSRRIERGFLSAVTDTVEKDRTPLFIVHRGTIREILYITAAHNRREVEITQNPHIEIAGWKYCEMFKTVLNDVDFSLRALRRSIYDNETA